MARTRMPRMQEYARCTGRTRRSAFRDSDTEPGVGANAARQGFTLIEVVVAIVILAIGVLGLAGTTGFVVAQTRLADITTERAAARQSVLERIRAQDLSAVTAGSTTLGEFQISWTVTASDPLSKTIQVVTTGPGLQSSGGLAPRLVSSVSDTYTFQKIDLRP